MIVQLTKPKPAETKPPELLPKEKLGENDPGEELDAGIRILIFPRRDRTKIAKISVHNESGDYTMTKAADGTFSVEGFEGAYLDDQKTASLVVTAGYTVTSQRVVDEATDEELENYGLAEPSAYWVLTDTSGKEYRVNVGDRMVSGDGYYCAYEGRRAVYVLSSTLETSILMPVEYYVTPLLVLGLTNDNYYQVDEFTVLHGSDDIFVSVARCSDEEKMNPDALMEAKLIYPAGYKANDSFYGDVISTFISMTGTDTVAIAPTEEQYEQYYRSAYYQKIITREESEPESEITREDAAKYIIRAINAEEYAKLENIFVCPFNDVTENIGYIAILYGMKIIGGNGNGCFNPSKPLKRADAAIMMYNYLSR